MIATPRSERFHLIAPTCSWCRCFPCVCERETTCQCGGHIYATDDLAGAVADHQQTPAHRAWRERMGL